MICHSNKLTFAILEKSHHHSAFIDHADPMQYEGNDMGRFQNQSGLYRQKPLRKPLKTDAQL